MRSNLTGNLVDICPVGALTSSPYKFSYRPWEIKKLENFDVLSVERSSIRVDIQGVGSSARLRVLPRGNSPWIGDKTRFGYDGRSRQRLGVPMVLVNGVLTPCSWKVAVLATAKKRNLEIPSQTSVVSPDPNLFTYTSNPVTSGKHIDLQKAVSVSTADSFEVQLGTLRSMETVATVKALQRFASASLYSTVAVRLESTSVPHPISGVDAESSFGGSNTTVSSSLSSTRFATGSRYSAGSTNSTSSTSSTSSTGFTALKEDVVKDGKDGIVGLRMYLKTAKSGTYLSKHLARLAKRRKAYGNSQKVAKGAFGKGGGKDRFVGAYSFTKLKQDPFLSSFATYASIVKSGLRFSGKEGFTARNLLKAERLGRRSGSSSSVASGVASGVSSAGLLRVGMDPKKEAPVWYTQVSSRNVLLAGVGCRGLDSQRAVAAQGSFGSGGVTLLNRITGREVSCLSTTSSVSSLVSSSILLSASLNTQTNLNVNPNVVSSGVLPLEIYLGQSVREREDSEGWRKFTSFRYSRVASGFSGGSRFFGTQWFPTSVGHLTGAYLGIGDSSIAASFCLPALSTADQVTQVNQGSKEGGSKATSLGLWSRNANLPKDWRKYYQWSAFQGSHGDPSVADVDVVLAGKSVTEESGTYIDLEGQRKHTEALHGGPGFAQENWAILKGTLVNRRAPNGVLPAKSSLERFSFLQSRYGSGIDGQVKRLDAPKVHIGGSQRRAGTSLRRLTPRRSLVENYFTSDRLASRSSTRAQCTRYLLSAEKRTRFSSNLLGL